MLDESRLGLVCGRRGRGSYAASIRRKLEGNDDTEEPLEEEDWGRLRAGRRPARADDDFGEHVTVEEARDGLGDMPGNEVCPGCGGVGITRIERRRRG